MEKCICGSGLESTQCCILFTSNEHSPTTALQLMRSRYYSFATGNANYLNNTSIQKQNEKDLTEWANSNQWKSLEIVDKSKGEETDITGTVTFKVLYTNDKKQQIQHIEKSTFVKHEQQWMYNTGEVDVKILPNTNQIIVGRNDLCTCGSGKKYKKCCG